VVHPSAQATNVHVWGNLPVGPPPPPPAPASTAPGFCQSSNPQPCADAASSAGAVVGCCTAGRVHAERLVTVVNSSGRSSQLRGQVKSSQVKSSQVNTANTSVESFVVDALHLLAAGNGHTAVTVVGVMYADDNGVPGALMAKTAEVNIQADAPRAFVTLPFAPPGVTVTPKFVGDTVWVGQIVSSPPHTAWDGSDSSMLQRDETRDNKFLSDGAAASEHAQPSQAKREPPGPNDLACFGFAPSTVHEPCRYSSEFVGAPPAFGQSEPCGSSLSIFATTVK
jgi:hypothetical protein